jgi:hypothetical protein
MVDQSARELGARIDVLLVVEMNLDEYREIDVYFRKDVFQGCFLLRRILSAVPFFDLLTGKRRFIFHGAE